MNREYKSVIQRKVAVKIKLNDLGSMKVALLV